jgi:hypothetical protein
MNASQLISVHRPEQTQLVVLSDRAWHTLQWREDKTLLLNTGCGQFLLRRGCNRPWAYFPSSSDHVITNTVI